MRKAYLYEKKGESLFIVDTNGEGFGEIEDLGFDQKDIVFNEFCKNETKDWKLEKCKFSKTELSKMTLVATCQNGHLEIFEKNLDSASEKFLGAEVEEIENCPYCSTGCNYCLCLSY